MRKSMKEKSPIISAFLMCIREDLGRVRFQIVESSRNDEYSVSFKLEVDPQVLVHVKAVTGTPPSFTVEFQSALDLGRASKGGILIPQSYNSLFDAIKEKFCI